MKGFCRLKQIYIFKRERSNEVERPPADDVACQGSMELDNHAIRYTMSGITTNIYIAALGRRAIHHRMLEFHMVKITLR